MEKTRIAVIGGGIVGCMIAYKILEEDPTIQLTLIDSSLIGSGATRYSAGVHFPVGYSERVRKLSIYSSNYYAKALEKKPNLPIYLIDFIVAANYLDSIEVGSYCLGLKPLPSKNRPPIIADLYPNLMFWDMLGCHVADVYFLVQIISYELQKYTQLIEGNKVISIVEKRELIQLKLSSGINLDFDYVVLAPGPWVNAIPFQTFTEQFAIRTKKVVAFHLKQYSQLNQAMFFPMEDFFLVPLPHRGHWLLSYTCQQWDVDPIDCLQKNITINELNEVKILIEKFIPKFSKLVLSGRVFCDAYSLNKEPIVASVGKSSNRIIFAGACNGAGYRLAPGIANDVINLIF